MVQSLVLVVTTVVFAANVKVVVSVLVRNRAFHLRCCGKCWSCVGGGEEEGGSSEDDVCELHDC